MEKMKMDTNRQTLIKELSKYCKWPKSFLSLMGITIEKPLACKVDKASEEEGEGGREIKLEVPKEPKTSSMREEIEKEEKPFGEIIYDGILEMYVEGLDYNGIQSRLKRQYGKWVSALDIMSVINNVFYQLEKWQSTALKDTYQYLHIERVTVREDPGDGKVTFKFVYIVIGSNYAQSGVRRMEVLWLGITDIGKDDEIFWRCALEELRSRGVKNIDLAFVYTLNGFKEAIAEVFPKASVQLCVIQMIRDILRHVFFEDMKSMIADINPIYWAEDSEASRQMLKDFYKKWRGKYPGNAGILNGYKVGINQFWSSVDHVIRREVIYNADVVESRVSFHRKIRKVVKKQLFLNDERALGFVFLILKNAQSPWVLDGEEYQDFLNEAINEKNAQPWI